MTRVLIADDHPIVLEGLCSLLEGAGMTIVARCRNGADAIEALHRLSPDVMILDVNMPGPTGIEIVARIARERARPKVILLSASFAEGQIDEAIDLRVDGIVLKEAAPQQLLACLESVLEGRRWFDPEVARQAFESASRTGPGTRLAPRERDVIRLAIRGLRNKQIARELGITEGTVKMYLHAAYEKLGVTSRFELMSRFNGRAP